MVLLKNSMKHSMRSCSVCTVWIEAQHIGYFALYTAWLSAFAMSGPLLGDGLLLYFLIPHVLGLLWLTQPGAVAWFQLAVLIGRWCCVIGTAGSVVVAGLAPALMVVLGFAAAPVCLRAFMALRDTKAPVDAAWLGLTAGHLLMLGLVNLPQIHCDGCAWTVHPGTLLLAVLLLWLGRAPAVQAASITGPVKLDGRLLAPIFFFQVASGLMYGGLFPAFAEHGFLADTHLVMLFYPLGALLALQILPYRRDVTLLVGVFLSLLGFALWPLLPVALGANVGMALTLGAAGIIDLLLLAHVLSFRNQRQAAGYGVAVLCSGIVLGKWIAVGFATGSKTIGLVSLVMLNLTAILLSLMRSSTAAPTRDDPASVEMATLPACPWIAQLSPQERAVLVQVCHHDKTYRAIATELGVSESTIKTYMQRIYRKAGVYNRKQLRHRLENVEK
jgi:DNA-binding CsgD family transcriptional regulator